MVVHGLGALALAFVTAIAFALLVARLWRTIPPRPGAAECAWREMSWSLPFGRQRLAPIGQPEPAPHRRPVSPNEFRRAQATVFVAVVETWLVAAMYFCWSRRLTQALDVPCQGTGWWVAVISAASLLVAWVVIDRRWRAKSPGRTSR